MESLLQLKISNYLIMNINMEGAKANAKANMYQNQKIFNISAEPLEVDMIMNEDKGDQSSDPIGFIDVEDQVLQETNSNQPNMNDGGSFRVNEKATQNIFLASKKRSIINDRNDASMSIAGVSAMAMAIEDENYINEDLTPAESRSYIEVQQESFLIKEKNFKNQSVISQDDDIVDETEEAKIVLEEVKVEHASPASVIVKRTVSMRSQKSNLGNDSNSQQTNLVFIEASSKQLKDRNSIGTNNSPRKKRIIIKNSSNNNQVQQDPQPPNSTIHQPKIIRPTSSRRPPTASRKKDSDQQQQIIEGIDNGDNRTRRKNQIQYNQTLNQHQQTSDNGQFKHSKTTTFQEAHSGIPECQISGCFISQHHNAKSSKSLLYHHQRTDFQNYADNSKPLDEKGGAIFDDLFDSLHDNLESDNIEQPWSKSNAIKDYAEKLKKEAMAKYENQKQDIKQKHEVTLIRLNDQKEQIEQKHDSLSKFINFIDQKVIVMAESSNHQMMIGNPTGRKDLTPQTLIDQGWKLVQNWIFSLITDTEKCVRYARLKSIKQVEHIKKEKLKYQESRVQQVLTQILKLQQFPFVKMTSTSKTLKSLSQQAIETFQQKFGKSSFEHIGTLRNKPHIKVSSNKSSQYQYKLSTFDIQQSFPSISTMLSRSGDIIKHSEEILHIGPQKIFLNGDQQNINSNASSNIVTNEILSHFQEPELTSKRELRVFYCTKNAASGQSREKSSHLSMEELIKQQSKGSNSLFFVDIENNDCSIKRLKATNQLKITLNATSQYAVLQECRFQHLLQSTVFQRYFGWVSQTNETIQNATQYRFYIIEENSIFACPQASNQSIPKFNQSKITNGFIRKIRHFRQLSDFEVVLLIMKSNGHLLTTSSNSSQSLELKLSQDALKRLYQFENTESKKDQSAQLLRSVYRQYAIIDKEQISGGQTYLIKRYLVKIENIMSLNKDPDQLEKQLCHWPNCLQCFHSASRNELLSEEQKQNTLSEKQSLSPINHPLIGLRKQRPESANVRNSQQSYGNQGQQTNRNIGGTRRFTRLPIVLDLDLRDSQLLKILLKRFKAQQPLQQQILSKDKSTKVLNAGPQQQNAFQANATIDQQKLVTQKSLDQSSQRNLQYIGQLPLCQYHGELEKFISSKLNITLLPIALRPNTFNKAIKTNFASWKADMKGSLAYELFQKNNKGIPFINDNIGKILSYPLTNHTSISKMPEVQSAIGLVYSQPTMINFLDNYYQWIFKIASNQKELFYKSPQFIEANEHFLSQLKAFNLNLAQARDNEVYLDGEIQRWMKMPSFLHALSNNQGSNSLNLSYTQISEILRSKDVIFKFQQFYALSFLINNGPLTGSSFNEPASAQQSLLPKISNPVGISASTVRPPNQTHTAGFFQKQESYNSNKTIDKLTLIYGCGSSNSCNSSSTGTNQAKRGMGALIQNVPSAQSAEHGRDATSESVKIGNNLSLQPLQRRHSAGRRKCGNNQDQTATNTSQYQGPPQYFSYQNQPSSIDTKTTIDYGKIMECQNSNKTKMQNMTKNDILLPLSKMNQPANKHRANSAHKLNQQHSLPQANSTQAGQFPDKNFTSYSSMQNQQTNQNPIRPATNISSYEQHSLRSSVVPHSQHIPINTQQKSCTLFRLGDNQKYK